MTVTLYMHGNLRRFMPDGRDRSTLEVDAGTSIRALLDSYGADRDTWLVAVNGTTVDKERVLAPGDHLDCFEPVAAG